MVHRMQYSPLSDISYSFILVLKFCVSLIEGKISHRCFKVIIFDLDSGNTPAKYQGWCFHRTLANALPIALKV